MSIALQMQVEYLAKKVRMLEAAKIQEENYAHLAERVQKLEGEIKAMKASMGKKPD